MKDPPFNLSSWWDDNLAIDPRSSDYGTRHKVMQIMNGAFNDPQTPGIRQRLTEKDKIEALLVFRETYSTESIKK